MEMRRALRLGIVLCTLGATGWAMASELKLGVGKCVITPNPPTWLAGYASRKAPAEGKIHDLYAKALAIEDEGGTRSVIVTSDLIGVTRDLSQRIAEQVLTKYSIPRERIIISASHTHCGPALHRSLEVAHIMDDNQAKLVADYTEGLPALFLQAIDAAVADLQSGSLSWGIGTATFAKNRREYTVTGITNGINPIGPVDHDVPVLVAKRDDGSIKAVLFGYACHNTTLSFQQYCGDYAGFAQLGIENALPDATALFAAGCAGDANPQPRGTLDLAQQHGDELAQAVLAVVKGSMNPVHGPVRAKFEEIPLALSAPPTREQLVEQTQASDVYVQRRAQGLLKQLDKKGALDTTYPYPVQVWKLSDTLQLTILGGEVVVDYALRLKHDLGRDKQFIIAYANDVCAYIPSIRVLREGAYEGDSSMIYYGFYGPWAPSVEPDILNTVYKLSKDE